jgi:hypothetical protein
LHLIPETGTLQLYYIVLYLLHIPAHPYKAKAIGYRTCHTTSFLNVDVQVLNKGPPENCSTLVGFQKWNPCGILKSNRSLKTEFKMLPVT